MKIDNRVITRRAKPDETIPKERLFHSPRLFAMTRGSVGAVVLPDKRMIMKNKRSLSPLTVPFNL